MRHPAKKTLATRESTQDRPRRGLSSLATSLFPGSRALGWLLLVCLIGALPTSGQSHQVNVDSITIDSGATMVALGDGFLVVWKGRISGERQVLARFLDEEGVPVGGEFRVDVASAGEPRFPSVTRLASGGFAAVWTNRNDSIQSVVARVFDAAGAPVTDNLLLHQVSEGRLLSDPRIAEIVGGLAVVWSEQGIEGDVDSGWGAYYRPFDLVGQPTAEVQRLHADPLGQQFVSSLERLVNGQLAVAWRTESSSVHQQVFARLIGSDGQLGPDELELSEFGVWRLGAVEIVSERETVLFLWSRSVVNFQSRLIGRHFDLSSQQLIGDEFAVDQRQDGFDSSPDGVSTPEGSLMVFAKSNRGLFTGYLDPAGIPIGRELSVWDAASFSGGPVLAVNPGDRPVLLWKEHDLLTRRIPRFVPILQPVAAIGCAGDTIEYDVDLFLHAFPGTTPESVELMAPDLASATFSPPSVIPPGSSTLSTTLPATASALRFAVVGDDGEDQVPSNSVRVEIRRSPPEQPPVLHEPPDRQRGVPTTPSFTWDPFITYDEGVRVDFVELEVARDPAFQDLTPPENLDPGERYYWRARGGNACGLGPYSETRTFLVAKDDVLAFAPGFLGEEFGSRLDRSWDIEVVNEDGEFVVASSQSYQLQFKPYGFGRRKIQVRGGDSDAVAFVDADTCRYGQFQNLCGPMTVASDGTSGDFHVVWREGGRYDDLTILQEVRGSIEGPTSDPVETLVTSEYLGRYPIGFQLERSSAGEGRFLMSWTRRNPEAPNDRDIFAQRMASDGSALGTPFRVHDESSINETAASSAFGSKDGDFLVVWEAELSSGGRTVRGRRFNSDGVAITEDFELTEATGVRLAPTVTAGPDGEFLVAWRSSESTGTDDHGWSVQGRRIGPLGPIGSEFQINSYTTRDQWDPSLAFDPVSGRYLATWRSGGSTGSDQSVWSIQARHLTADGQPISQDFQVNIDTYGYQYDPRVVASPGSGEFIVAWREPHSLLYRRLSVTPPLIFADGFESGNTEAWGE